MESQLGAKLISLFSVFDGHSGQAIASFCSQQLPQFITKSKAFLNGDYGTAMTEAYCTMDEYLRDSPQYKTDHSGCTAVTLLVTEKELFCANAGDSRCVLCRGGQAFLLSNDHKPSSPTEMRRIHQAAGLFSTSA